MKSFITLLSLSIFIYSCNHDTKKQADIESSKKGSPIAVVDEEADRAVYLQDSLNGAGRTNITRHLKEYCPVKLQMEINPIGGVKAGTVFIENKTGYTIRKVVIGVEYIKENGSVISTQYIEFNNLANGDSQAKPTVEEPIGARVRATYVSIMSSELTNGQQISLGY